AEFRSSGELNLSMIGCTTPTMNGKCWDIVWIVWLRYHSGCGREAGLERMKCGSTSSLGNITLSSRLVGLEPSKWNRKRNESALSIISMGNSAWYEEVDLLGSSSLPARVLQYVSFSS